MDMPQTRVGDHMLTYYDLRAPEYDDWWLGAGQYARPRPGWREEVGELVAALGFLAPARVLDVACGTAFLTAHLRGRVVCLDQSLAMLRLAAARVPEAAPIRGDAAPLPFRDAAFGRVFTSHFYGHLLPGERASFLDEARRVADQLVVVDAALREDVAAEGWQERRLRDGSRHSVYKRYFTAAGLAAELGGGRTLHEGRWFVAVTT